MFVVCVAVENLHNSASLHTNLHAGLLGSSRGNLGMVVGLRGLHRESHHRSCDRGWRSVIIGDLYTNNSETHPVIGRKVSSALQAGFDIMKAPIIDL